MATTPPAVGKMPNLFAALFKGGKSTEEDDEGGSAPAQEREARTGQRGGRAKSADPVPMPRAKPAGSTIQLASADAQIVSAPKAKPESRPRQAKRQAAQASAEPKPQTPADIINARGFWDDIPTAANRRPPRRSQRCAHARCSPPPPIRSRPPASPKSFNKAMAYAPAASSPVDRANIVAATAPIPRPARPARNAGAAATEDQYRGRQGRAGSGRRGRDLDPSRRRQGQQISGCGW